MKKVLMLASVASMIDKFNMDNIRILQDMGYLVEVAANFDFGSITSQERVDAFHQELIDDDIKVHNIRIPRRVFDMKGILNAYKKVKNLCGNGYSMVHCHSPIGGVIARLAFRKERKKNTKVIYTAHGFHFFKGASLLNWLIYFPVEWISSFMTDVLITINKEDFEFAKKHMHAKSVKYVPGIGVDTQKYKKETDSDISKYNADIALLSIGELNKNKNHEVVLRAMAALNNKGVHYFIAGKGDNEEYLLNIAKELKVEDRFHLLGFVNNVNKVLSGCDIFCFPSFREGLPVSLMEAMAAGLPCAVSNIRGNTDLIEDGKGGYLCNPGDSNDFREKIQMLCENKVLREDMGMANKSIVKKFDTTVISEKMKDIYGIQSGEIKKEMKMHAE